MCTVEKGPPPATSNHQSELSHPGFPTNLITLPRVPSSAVH